jgi:hypothetical protein
VTYYGCAFLFTVLIIALLLRRQCRAARPAGQVTMSSTLGTRDRCVQYGNDAVIHSWMN